MPEAFLFSSYLPLGSVREPDKKEHYLKGYFNRSEQSGSAYWRQSDFLSGKKKKVNVSWLFGQSIQKVQENQIIIVLPLQDFCQVLFMNFILLSPGGW